MSEFNKLSRAEMKSVLGGYAQTFTCTYTINGTTQTSTITAANGNAAQCIADSACWSMDECTNVDCGGSGAC